MSLSTGLGMATANSRGEIIEVYYPQPELNPEDSQHRILSAAAGIAGDTSGFGEIADLQIQPLLDELRNAGLEATASLLGSVSGGDKTLVYCVEELEQAPASIPAAFLKLHLLSHRLVKPHGANLTGLFGVLKNLAWTDDGAIDLDDLPARQIAARKQGRVLDVQSVDKFPKMTDYIVPRGVRIADTARVRLGAYIGEGTTVMHEGFVNFNAGTLGTAMIEGRISAGVVVGKNSDLGGGCSTMGTLSGGGTTIISVGENCLIGANAGIGFPLADGCIVEAGLYVTGGTKVNVLDAKGEVIETVKAGSLSERKNLLFRRNSLTGTVEAVPTRTSISLNEELHSHN
ncbi:MAG: DapH/DapD/GlmU-related protein [Proteobacteria bacterium]|nr:DapH/DapD/GlmU-related protein [Pseudomonadota bacterium]MDA0928981.1 DapH/DapD/GlmU-related protein [Pseudomonadota bacterium]